MNHRTITFKAIPYPIRAEYRVQLVQLGQEACRCFKRLELQRPMNPADAAAYEDASRLLEMYEKTLRRAMGVEITRPEFDLSRQP